MSRTWSYVERLETRVLLANIGIDLTFGQGGYAPVSGSSVLEVTPDGKILAANGAKITRLNADGSVDPTFVDKGNVSSDALAIHSAVISGNRIVIAGAVYNTQSVYVRAIRLSTGDVDTRFGNDGIFYFTPQPVKANPRQINNNITSVIATSDGGTVISVTQYLVHGDYPGASSYGDILFKLGTHGKFDSTFGNNGALVVNQDESNGMWADLAALPNGKFLVLGESRGTSSLWRYNNNGTLDTTFGDEGSVVLEYDIQFPSYDELFVQPDGKILIPADSNPDIGGQNYLIRRNANGTNDTSFGENGLITGITAQDVAFDAEGRILGTAGQLFRLTPNGQPDPTFDDDGFVATSGYVRIALLESPDWLLLGSGDAISRFGPAEPVRIGPAGTVRIDGTDTADTITAVASGGEVNVTFNGRLFSFFEAEVSGFSVFGNGGDDQITLGVDVNATVDGGGGNDVIITAGGDDFINGEVGADTVDAGAGRDVVFGGDGNDFLSGGAGADHMFGDTGNDSIAGGDGDDRLFGGGNQPPYPGFDGYADGDDSLSGNAGNDRCDGMVGNDRVAGNGGRDRLFGSDGADRLYGGASGDWLYGAEGADQLFGEGGADRLYADDIIPDYLGQIGIDTLRGGAGNDWLISKEGQLDYLFGDGGRDSSFADATDVLTSIEVRT